MAIGVSHLGMGTPPGLSGDVCVTGPPSGREKRSSERSAHSSGPCDRFWSAYLIILDLPLLLPDANGTGGRTPEYTKGY